MKLTKNGLNLNKVGKFSQLFFYLWGDVTRQTMAHLEGVDVAWELQDKKDVMALI